MAAYVVIRREEGHNTPVHDGVNFYIIFETDDNAALGAVLADLVTRGIPTDPWDDAIVQAASDILLMRGTVIDGDNVQFD